MSEEEGPSDNCQQSKKYPKGNNAPSTFGSVSECRRLKVVCRRLLRLVGKYSSAAAGWKCDLKYWNPLSRRLSHLVRNSISGGGLWQWRGSRCFHGKNLPL